MIEDVTRILEAVDNGDRQAAELLLPVVYTELRRLAAARMAEEKPGQTLQPTALVHEAYIRLVGGNAEQGGERKWQGRGHFFAAAAEAMRRILIENVRRKKSLKRGGAGQREELADVAAPDADDQILALDEALTRLAAEDALAARVVELRHFAGLGHEQIADALGITVYLARQKWTFARARLKSAIDRS